MPFGHLRCSLLPASCDYMVTACQSDLHHHIRIYDVTHSGRTPRATLVAAAHGITTVPGCALACTRCCVPGSDNGQRTRESTSIRWGHMWHVLCTSKTVAPAQQRSPQRHASVSANLQQLPQRLRLLPRLCEVQLLCAHLRRGHSGAGKRCLCGVCRTGEMQPPQRSAAAQRGCHPARGLASTVGVLWQVQFQ